MNEGGKDIELEALDSAVARCREINAQFSEFEATRRITGVHGDRYADERYLKLEADGRTARDQLNKTAAVIAARWRLAR